jgi:hypothetical protein
VESRFKYSFISSIFNLRLSCRAIALALDPFFRKSFETINVDISFAGIQRAVQLAQTPQFASRVQCVRLRFTLFVPGEDVLLEKMAVDDEDKDEWTSTTQYSSSAEQQPSNAPKDL